MPTRDAPGAPHGENLLSDCLAEAMRQVGAHTGSVYLLRPGDQILELAVMKGLPREFARAYEQVSIRAPNPVADALRTGSLVWAGPEEMVHRYPRVALSTPYRHAVAALPLATASATYGSMLMLWPGSRSDPPSPWERERLEEAAATLAQRLEEAARAGRPARAGPELPELVPAARPADAGELAAMAARLPEGLCALDSRGRFTFISPAAAELVGASPEELVGAHPWEVLPWSGDPVYEDRFRAAMVSQQPTSFTVLRPPGRWLFFQLYPDVSGLSVRITPAPIEIASEQLAEAQPAAARPDVPTRPGAIHNLVHLASALAEAVSVRDVVDLVADEILPSFGSHALVLLTVDNGCLRAIGHRGYQPTTIGRFDNMPLTSHLPPVQAVITGTPAFFGSPQELYRAYPALRGDGQGRRRRPSRPALPPARPTAPRC
jgi:PAS domain S-box-containing protein